MYKLNFFHKRQATKRNFLHVVNTFPAINRSQQITISVFRGDVTTFYLIKRLIRYSVARFHARCRQTCVTTEVTIQMRICIYILHFYTYTSTYNDNIKCIYILYIYTYIDTRVYIYIYLYIYIYRL